MLSYILVILFLLVVLYFKFDPKRRRIVKCLEEFAGLAPLPIIGSIHEVFCSRPEFIGKAQSIGYIFKNRSKFWLLHKPFIAIYNPEDMQHIAPKLSEKHEILRSMADLIGNGLITAKVEKWKHTRRIISGAFNLSISSKAFLNVFNQQNTKLMHALETEADTDRQFDLWHHIFKSSYNTINEIAMGHSDDIDEKEFTRTREAFHKATYLISQRFFHPWLLPSFMFKLYLWFIGCRKLIPQCQSLPLKILNQRRRKSYENRHLSVKDAGNVESDEKSLKTLIDVLLDTKDTEKPFTDKEITDEVLTILFAGSETTALTVCFTLLMLAINQEIQDVVYEELVKIFGNSDRQPTQEDLLALTYLEKCIKETLRRYSPAPVSIRKATEDIALADGKIIPAGVSVVLPYSLIHLDRTIYPNPDTWNPTNFDEDKVAKRTKGSFVPFGVGARTCIGNKYAMLATKAQLSTVLRRFRVSTSLKEHDIILWFDMVLRSSNGYPVKLHSRH